MKLFYLLCIALLLSACGSRDKGYHTVKVIKPIYHKGYYKNSVWHKRLQVGRIRIRWFEKQGVKTVKMKG